MDDKKFNKLIDELRRKLEKEPFIENPNDYIKTNFNIQNPQLLMSFYAIIMFHNNDCLVKLEAENRRLRKIINQETIFVEESEKTISQPETQILQETQKNNVENIDQIFEVIDFFESVDDIVEYLSNISIADIPYIKLQIYKRVVEIKKEIYNLSKESSKDSERIKTLNQTLEKLTKLIKRLSRKEVIETSFESEEELTGIVGQNQRIVFVGNDENSSYLYEDIINRRDDKFKDLMAVITKILNGSFLKSTKSIQSNRAKLYEYYNPNGIRIMYIVEKNIIAICSFFDKDKTKSIKISKFYDEAISRFEKRKQYIIDNLDNPNFWIEQQEYIGQIYGLFEDRGLIRKRGEDNE